MIKTVLLLTGLALVHARSNGQAVDNSASSSESIELLPNGCPADFDIEYLLPHEECEKYYQCDDGEKIERDCQVGTVFNSDIQACDWPLNVPQCEGSPGATAPPTTPDSSDEASDQDWEALPNGCPADFDIVYQLPHESECSNYYACNNGELVEMECPPGLHFSQSLQICTWPDQAGCAGSQDVADTIKQKSSDTELQEEWKALPNGCPANYEIDFLLPHEDDCEKFYYCVHGQKVEFACGGGGTHFSLAQQKCTWPEEAGCAN